jgi:hypothetical protein
MGGARTGTHLLNSVLCRSPALPPMLSETAPFVEIVSAYERSLAHRRQFPGVHFGSDGEVLSLYAPLARAFVEQLKRRYRSEACVIRSPALTRRYDAVAALLEAADVPFIVLCMVRDPRDAVASMLVWERKRIAGGGQPLNEGPDRIDGLARFLWSFYPGILDGGATSRTHFIRYEDLVRAPTHTIARLAELTRLELAGCPSGDWSGPVPFTATDPRIGTAITPLYGQPISAESVGAWRRHMTASDGARIMRFCAPITRRFYPHWAEEAPG